MSAVRLLQYLSGRPGLGVDLLVVSTSCLTAVNRAPYRDLLRRGWRVELVVPARLKAPGGYDQPAEPRVSGDPPLHALEITSTHPRSWTFRGLRPLLNELKPRVVLIDVDPASRLGLEIGYWAKWNAARVACITGDNLLRTVAGEFRRSFTAGLRLLFSRTLALIARRIIDHVFVMSRDSQELMERLGFAGRVTLIPLGYDPAVFYRNTYARTRVRTELALHELTFAYFGRLIPEKGVAVLIHALAQLRDRPWQLLLDEFGEYPDAYAVQLRSLIHSVGLQERVVFFDAPHSRIADYMNAADVVVLPSICGPTFREQYGRVVPEAMACGKLVVVSTCGALPEVAGPPSIVVPQNDVGALAAALEQILDDRTVLDRVAALSVAHATSYHSLTVQCDHIEILLRQGADLSRVARAAVPPSWPK